MLLVRVSVESEESGVGRAFGVWACVELFEPLRQKTHLRKETQGRCFGTEVALAGFLTSEAI